MKSFFVRGILTGCAVAATLFFTGCSSSGKKAKDKQDDRVLFKRPDKIVYEQIPSIGCRLEPVGSLDVEAGTPCELNLMLTNASRRNIVIKEWYMIDQYNFTVFYRRLPADRPVNENAPFQRYQVHIPLRPLPNHSELRLAPGEIAELSVKLPFVGDLAPGEKAAFEVYIATSLETFKLKSALFVVTAR